MCEAWFLSLRVEHKLHIFENKDHAKVFGAKKDDVRDFVQTT
jgi:hypothetical protein